MEPVHPIAPFEPLFKMTQLRMQNVWRIKVKGNREDERTHALSLYVHIRNNDLDYFNTNSSVYTQVCSKRNKNH
jgi:hypothetical protein